MTGFPPNHDFGGPFSELPPSVPRPDLLRPVPGDTAPIIGNENDLTLDGASADREYGDPGETYVLGIDEALVAEPEPAEPVTPPVAAALGDAALPDPEPLFSNGTAASGPEVTAPDEPTGTTDVTFIAPPDVEIPTDATTRTDRDLPEPTTATDAGRPAQQVADVSALRETEQSKDPFHGLDRGIREATHAFRPAEEVDGDALDAYYGHLATRNAVWRGWHQAELAISEGDPHMLVGADAYAQQAHDRYTAREPGEVRVTDTPGNQPRSRPSPFLAHGADMLRAAIPTIFDRITTGEVRPETAADVYKTVTTELVTDAPDFGTAAETIIWGLGARQTALEGDPNAFMHLSSPREGESTLKDNGLLSNHDMFTVESGAKVPIEVKLSGNTRDLKSGYAPDIRYVKFFEDVAAPALGLDLNEQTHGQRQTLIPVAIGMLTDLMRDEVNNPGVRHAELDTAYRALRDTIESQAIPNPNPRLATDLRRRRT